jgi:Holliday junction resolvase RusA-like endonuclease
VVSEGPTYTPYPGGEGGVSTVSGTTLLSLGAVRFHVLGAPIPKGRPRAYHAGEHIRMYTPATTADWERSIREQARVHRPAQLLDGPLAIELTFYRLRPKSAPRRITLPATRPDLDNLAKAVLDALRGVIYRDDAQIVDKLLRKRFGDPPGVTVLVRPAVAGGSCWREECAPRCGS